MMINSSHTLRLAYFCTGIRGEAEFMAMRAFRCLMSKTIPLGYIPPEPSGIET